MKTLRLIGPLAAASLAVLGPACGGSPDEETASVPADVQVDRLQSITAVARGATARDALAALGSPASDDAAEQVAVLEGLAERGDFAHPARDFPAVKAVRALLLESPVPDVRAAAAEALASWFSDPANLEHVRSAAASDPDPLVRARARATLADAGE